ncbi:hypothetical protein [Nocardia sp. NPDC051981]|uniref:hypothetical protein n=1 Tax=Nocardia sp. NPDC051981 TaxID=3155417 RepID=UPI003413E652
MSLGGNDSPTGQHRGRGRRHLPLRNPVGRAVLVRRGRHRSAEHRSYPGRDRQPGRQFSAGARQPGTSYTDFCVGNQLIPGTDDVYQVVRLPGDVMLWKAAHPISQWDFDTARPAPTWRAASLCIDGVLT